MGLECPFTPIVLWSWFTLPEVCLAGIVKHTVKSSNSVHSGEISRLFCHYAVNTQFSLLIRNTSEIATLQFISRGLVHSSSPVQIGCILISRLSLPGTLYARTNAPYPQNT